MADVVTHSISVLADLGNVYDFWADFERFPLFMKNIKSVAKTGDRTSHWVMQGPLGIPVEWDAETTRMDKNREIAWRSTGGDIRTSGQVTFEKQGENQTGVTVRLGYKPPAGLAGNVVAELFGNPEGRLADDLRRFKEFIEGTDDRIHRDTRNPDLKI